MVLLASCLLILVKSVPVLEPTSDATLGATSNCLEYDQNNECIRCQDRFFLKAPPVKSISEHPTCQPCIDGCLHCRDGTVCQQCDSRHTQRPGSSTCELCDSSCATCGVEPTQCTSCPKFSSLDKARGKCTWTFRIIIGGLTLVAIVLLSIVLAYSCQGKKSKKKPKRSRLETDNILAGDYTEDNYKLDNTRAQLISSVNMIGVGNNETNLSEVDRQTEEPYSNADDLGSIVKNNLGDRRYR